MRAKRTEIQGTIELATLSLCDFVVVVWLHNRQDCWCVARGVSLQWSERVFASSMTPEIASIGR